MPTSSELIEITIKLARRYLLHVDITIKLAHGQMYGIKQTNKLNHVISASLHML